MTTIFNTLDRARQDKDRATRLYHLALRSTHESVIRAALTKMLAASVAETYEDHLAGAIREMPEHFGPQVEARRAAIGKMRDALDRGDGLLRDFENAVWCFTSRNCDQPPIGFGERNNHIHPTNAMQASTHAV